MFRPFSGKYLRLKDEGVYSCVVCDNPIFSSESKYVSGCGWPSFNDVIAQGKVTFKTDTAHGELLSNKLDNYIPICLSGDIVDSGLLL